MLITVSTVKGILIADYATQLAGGLKQLTE